MTLTPEELTLNDQLGVCMMMFAELEMIHPSDVPEFQQHIHALQNIVLSRSAMREYESQVDPKMAVEMAVAQVAKALGVAPSDVDLSVLTHGAEGMEPDMRSAAKCTTRECAWSVTGRMRDVQAEGEVHTKATGHVVAGISVG